MDAAKALADLTEISTQIEAAVIATRSGEVVASTIDDDARAGRFARAADQLLAAAAGGEGEPVQLEAALGDASVFVVREGDRLIAAATGPEPTAGLVFYDLKSALRSSAEEAPAEEAKPEPAPKRAAPKKAADEAPKPPPPKPKRAPRSKPAPKAEETDGAA